jgi:hypothetical protein
MKKDGFKRVLDGVWVGFGCGSDGLEVGLHGVEAASGGGFRVVCVGFAWVGDGVMDASNAIDTGFLCVLYGAKVCGMVGKCGEIAVLPGRDSGSFAAGAVAGADGMGK